MNRKELEAVIGQERLYQASKYSPGEMATIVSLESKTTSSRYTGSSAKTVVLIRTGKGRELRVPPRTIIDVDRATYDARQAEKARRSAAVAEETARRKARQIAAGDRLVDLGVINGFHPMDVGFKLSVDQAEKLIELLDEPFCNACGQRHATGDCDLRPALEEAWADAGHDPQDLPTGEQVELIRSTR